METSEKSKTWIDMFSHPVFRAVGDHVAEVNEEAQQCGISVGSDIFCLLGQNAAEYTAFSGGSLSVGITVDSVNYMATVLPTADGNVFHLQGAYDSDQMRTVALIAQQLRKPLSGIMTATDTLYPDTAFSSDSAQKKQFTALNRSMHQLFRQVSNLTAAADMGRDRRGYMETQNIVSLIDEQMQTSAQYADMAGRTLLFSGIAESIYCQVDTQVLERAIYNLISNAINYSPAGSTVSAHLSRIENRLQFSVENTVSEDITPPEDLFFRFNRIPNIEDCRHGMGLGIPLVQYASSVHGGCLLMDRPSEKQIRFTFSLPILQKQEAVVRSPVLRIDYLGGRDHALVELSDVLPCSAYE